MLLASFPGEFLSWTWWLWALSGIDCILTFLLLWFYYRSQAHRKQISKTMAVLWATVVTVPGLFFAAGALWWLIETIRIASI